MPTWYTRQSSAEIVTDQVIEASDFNNEFNAIATAFLNVSSYVINLNTDLSSYIASVNTNLSSYIATVNTNLSSYVNYSLNGSLSSFSSLSSFAVRNLVNLSALSTNQITQLTGFGSLADTGIVVRSGLGTFGAKTLTGTTNQVVVTNGNGTAGNPTFTLATNLITPGSVDVSGTLGLADNEVDRPWLKDYAVSVKNYGSIATNSIFDYSLGPVFTATFVSSATLSISNPPASGRYGEVMLILCNGGVGSVTWTNFKWPGGIAPILATAGVDIIAALTVDGGASWRGSIAQAASA